MNFLMIRHGETSWNAEKKIQGSTDIPLNETGRLQAEALGEQIQREGISISRIYTSRQLRARQTAGILSNRLGLEVRMLDGLEEMNMGVWEGLNWEEVEERFPEEFARWSRERRYIPAPGGESYQEVLERLIPTLGLVAGQESGDVLVVTHSAVIMSLLSFLYNTPFHEMIDRYRTQNCTIVKVSQADVLSQSCCPGDQMMGQKHFSGAR